ETQANLPWEVSFRIATGEDRSGKPCESSCVQSPAHPGRPSCRSRYPRGNVGGVGEVSRRSRRLGLSPRPRMEGGLETLRASAHRTKGPPLPRGRRRRTRSRFPPRGNPPTTESLRAPDVWTYLRRVRRCGPTESGRRRGLGECG